MPSSKVNFFLQIKISITSEPIEFFPFQRSFTQVLECFQAVNFLIFLPNPFEYIAPRCKGRIRQCDKKLFDIIPMTGMTGTFSTGAGFDSASFFAFSAAVSFTGSGSLTEVLCYFNIFLLIQLIVSVNKENKLVSLFQGLPIIQMVILKLLEGKVKSNIYIYLYIRILGMNPIIAGSLLQLQ